MIEEFFCIYRSSDKIRESGKKMYKAIVFDLDGTLLDDNKKISTNTLNWIKSYQRQGGVVILASGRKIQEIKPYAEELDMLGKKGCYIASSSGAYLRNLSSGEIQEFKLLNVELVRRIIDKLFKENTTTMCTVVTESFDWIISKRIIGNWCKNIILKLRGVNQGFISYNAVEKISGKIEKIVIGSENVTKVKNALETIEDIRICLTDRKYIEIHSLFVDKSFAIKSVLDDLNLSEQDVLIFGDDENDYQTFVKYTNTVAMENAVTKLKAVAKYTTRSNRDEGVYHFLKTNVGVIKKN